MTDRELERRLKDAVAREAPDDLEGVLSRCGSDRGTVLYMPAQRQRTGGWKRGLIAACLALALFAGGGGGLFYQQAHAVASVISLDVNPSIELTVNRGERVLSCTGLNDEAAQVLSDMGGGRDLVGAKLNVAVNAVVGALVRSGYLDRIDSALLISVDDADADRAAWLQQELVASVDGVLQSASSQISVLSQSVTADKRLNTQAQENNISTGKAALVEQVIDMNGQLSFADLAALSVEELRDMLKTGAPAMPIGQAAALDAALLSAGGLELGTDGFTGYEVDPELDDVPACYEVELRVNGRELEYRVDAYTGEIIAAPAALSGPAITAGAAQRIALDHAGVTLEETVSVQCQQDDERYEVAFSTAACGYEYEIACSDGRILSFSSEPYGTGQGGSRDDHHAAAVPAPGGDIGQEAALSAALAHAGLTREQVTHLEWEREAEDGGHHGGDRLEYEVSFDSGGWEYEYTIDGATGAILEHEREYDD